MQDTGIIFGDPEVSFLCFQKGNMRNVTKSKIHHNPPLLTFNSVLFTPRAREIITYFNNSSDLHLAVISEALASITVTSSQYSSEVQTV